MKRILAIVMVMLFSQGWILAQSTLVSSVVGCEFSDNGMSVRTKLHAKFGVKPTKDLGNEVVYSKVEIGGVHYDYAHFFFRSSLQVGKSEFASAVLKKQFLATDRAKAIAYYRSLQTQYRRKYANFEALDYDNTYISQCGENPDGMTGDEYPIRIALEDDIAHVGEKYIYVTVTYYPSALEAIRDQEI